MPPPVVPTISFVGAITPRTSPVSAALTIGAKAKRLSSYTAVLQIIDSVHDDGQLSSYPIPLIEHRRGKEPGLYASGKHTRLPIGIQISRIGPHPELTLTHEVGHWIDHRASGIPGGFASEFSSDLADWRAAIIASPTYKTIALAAAGEPINDDGDYAYGAPSDFRYLLLWEELWARAYTQFIVKRSAHPGLTQQFTVAANLYDGLFFWSMDDFNPIEFEIEKHFRALTWIP